VTQATRFNVFWTASSRDAGVDPLVKKLRSFGKLPDGWSYGRGTRIPAGVLGKAEQFLELGQQLHLKAEVFPGTDGDVIVAFHRKDRTVQVRVNNDCSLGLRIERGDGADFEDVIEPIERVDNEAEISSSIIELTEDEEAWKSRASSTSFTLVEYADASSTQHLRIPARDQKLLAHLTD